MESSWYLVSGILFCIKFLGNVLWLCLCIAVPLPRKLLTIWIVFWLRGTRIWPYAIKKIQYFEFVVSQITQRLLWLIFLFYFIFWLSIDLISTKSVYGKLMIFIQICTLPCDILLLSCFMKDLTTRIDKQKMYSFKGVLHLKLICFVGCLKFINTSVKNNYMHLKAICPRS